VSQFVTSILNYYAAFTETRFSNKSTLNYKWLDDANLTLDLSFFTDFFRMWVNKLEQNDLAPVDVGAGRYQRVIPTSKFRSKLSELLNGAFNHERLNSFLVEEREGKEVTTPEEIRESFLEAARAYNLDLRKAVQQIIHSLQQEEIKLLQDQFRASRLPVPTFNVPKFSQDIYDHLQLAAAGCDAEEEYFPKIASLLRDRDYTKPVPFYG